MRIIALTAWVVTFGISCAYAQTAQRKEPVYYAGVEGASRVEAPPGIRFGLRKPKEFALLPLSESEKARLAEPGLRLKTGLHRTLSAAAIASGVWSTAPDGTRLWRTSLRSPGSQGIRIEFRNFSVGAGKVWVHDGAHFAGPYTGRGLFDDGHFWSASVASDSVTVEYQPAPDAAEELEPPFEIRTLTHQGRARPLYIAPLPLAQAPVTQTGTADPADYCHLDPNCYPDWQPAMKMVGQLTFEDAGLEYLCSGSLVATRDNSMKPYLLTAGHCINNEDSARSLEVYWSYQTASCGGPPPTSRDSSTTSTGGGHLIGFGTIPQGDYSLLLLQNLPSNVTFSGWDASDPPQGAALTGIHHPEGSWKRISFGNRVSDVTVDVEGEIAPSNLYLETEWTKGRTEPGSSGSPLFSSPGVIVGTLTYGPSAPGLSACQIEPSVDGYGRFSNTYLALQPYLEDFPAAIVSPSPASLAYTISNYAAAPAQAVSLSTQSPGQIGFKLRADAAWIGLSTTTGTLTANSPVQVKITVDPSQLEQAGRYTSTVTILSGAAAPQFINVTANVQVAQSNVVAAVTPNPVYQANGEWTFQIQLAETAGTGTAVTAMKINGTDYSAYIPGWFKTNHINANGSMTASLQGAGFAPGTQYFEFWGVDDGSGQDWYRVIVATFQ